MSKTDKETAFRNLALDYHSRDDRPGKIAIHATKPMATQQDLALAYSPGVAVPCEEIADDPLKAYDYTSKGNLVAVISDGTAVLGLGNIGALASKPVMEGKAVLFKKFANIDSVDVEIDLKMSDDADREEYIQKMVDTIAALEPTYGGINLEDYKAPECFEIERRLKERMNIPVFHDDQHGTAIIVTAAVTNWLEWSGRKASDIKLVCNGAGASAMACLNLLVHAGLKKENITVCDRNGVIYEGRNEGMDPYKEKYASKTNARDLKDAIKGADIFLGLSGPNMVDADMVKSMADAPLIMALANPTPEIMPDIARKARPDCIVCTGRSDFTNQVNNVLCFPFLFRGALDVGATTINEEMKLACVNAIAALARKEAIPEVASVYSDETLSFGPDYLIPKPFDPRLIVDLPIAVAKAAMESGVATRPITDFEAYKQKLRQFYIRSQLVMQPIVERAKENPKRIVFCEGEEERVLQAAQMVLDEGVAVPLLIGRKRVVQKRIETLGLRLKIGENIELTDPENDKRYKDYWQTYHGLMKRNGVTIRDAKTLVRTQTTLIGAIMVHKSEADGMISGTTGHYHDHLKYVMDVVGMKEGVEMPAALTCLILSTGTYFISDTHVNPDPDVDEMVDATLLAIETVKRFGMTPKVAMLSHSNFGTSMDDSAFKMRMAADIIREYDGTIDIDGEMHADCALSQTIRDAIMPDSDFEGAANLFMMPNIEAASITYNMVKVLTGATVIGPLLLGMNCPCHIVTPATSARGLMNAAAISSVGAQNRDIEQAQ